jgi:two-component system phosphate regulon sensor histidine kinase PhoR
MKRGQNTMSEPLILVADDNQEIRDFLEDILTKLGKFEVKSVGDGLSALSLVQEMAPDVVITDHHMPGLSGLDLIRRLRLNRPGIPIILMTSESTESLAIEALRAGASDYLVKPFEPDDLISMVQRCMAQSKKMVEFAGANKGARVEQEMLESRMAELAVQPVFGRPIESVLELDQVLAAAVDTAVRLTGAEEGSLLLIDEESGELYMRASKNFDDEFSRTFRVPVRDSLAGQAIETGQPVRLDEGTPQKIKTSYLVHSLVYAPLRVRNRVIGVLGVDNRTRGKALSDHDIAILTTMADYAALAIENAQLYLRSEAERSQLETILTQIENGVIVVDVKNRLMLINKMAQEAFGISNEHLGEPAEKIFKDPKLLALINLPSDQSKREEIELDDGKVFHAQRTPIEDVGQAIVMQEITHLKELDRIKSDFVTTVSHDLRSPLTAILGYIELIGRAGEVNEQQREFISRVQSSVQQISYLISDLLDLGRIEAGLDTTKEYVEMTKLIREICLSMEGAARAAKVEFQRDIQEHMGQVFGDPVRLKQMLGNLIDNALKYAPIGGQVHLGARSEGDQIILTVSDNGPGIPLSDQPYLFNRFFRASNVPEDVSGTGLGLSIVKSILDNHNGRIWVESQLGEGATFTVVLPMAKM